MREPALRDVTLDIAPGELVVVCGPSGGGKSTLLRALQGIVPQLSGGELVGDVSVLGHDATRTRPHDLAAAGVTLVFQNPLEGFVADRVEDEVAFGPESLGLAEAAIAARVATALEDVGLAHAAQRRVASLSGGEQQRVAIAAALALEPRLLLLDEPTAHLDETTAAQIVALLERVRRARAISVVIAEHRLGLVAPLADRVAVMAAGTVRALGAPRDVLATPGLDGLGVPVPRALVAASRLGLAGAPLTPAELARALRSRGDGAEVRSTASTPTRGRDEAPVVTDAHRGFPVVAEAPSGIPAPAELALRFAGVTYRYPDSASDALRGVDLVVARGERVALVGPSGAGKSTIARLALGLARPSAGEITLLGVRSPTTAAVATRVGLVVQNPMRQLLAETVAGEIALGLRRLARADRDRRVAEALERFDLTAVRERHPLSLSEGQRRRLALAAAIAPQPELLILDEPTLAQDETQRRALTTLVLELATRGTAILAITHDPEFANDACDRVVALAGGGVTADLPLSGDAPAIARLAEAGIPLADVPATVLALSRDGAAPIEARTVGEFVEALG